MALRRSGCHGSIVLEVDPLDDGIASPEPDATLVVVLDVTTGVGSVLVHVEDIPLADHGPAFVEFRMNGIRVDIPVCHQAVPLVFIQVQQTKIKVGQSTKDPNAMVLGGLNVDAMNIDSRCMDPMTLSIRRMHPVTFHLEILDIHEPFRRLHSNATHPVVEDMRRNLRPLIEVGVHPTNHHTPTTVEIHDDGFHHEVSRQVNAVSYIFSYPRSTPEAAIDLQTDSPDAITRIVPYITLLKF